MKANRQTESSDGIVLSDYDYERLSLLVQHASRHLVEALEDELSRAQMIPQKEMPNDIVTMNTRVLFIDEATGRSSEVTLVYPKDADIAQMKVSVLAPIGTALLGLRIGQSIRWPMPNGKERILKIHQIIYQPEAHQNWEL